MEQIRATIGILTFNSEKNLGRALESVREFEEIIVADGGSTDRTIEIAKRYGARVIPQSNPGHPITDFALERNRVLDAATMPWFMHIDSDEIVSPELVEFIRTVSEGAYQAYHVRYLKTNEDASRIYRTYREYYQIRLFRTDIGARYVRTVHERVELPNGISVGQTEAPWYVPLDAGDLQFSPFVRKAWERTRLTALSWQPRGVFDVARKVVVEPALLILKSLSKLVLVRLKWGREAIPVKYELLRIVYTKLLVIRNLERAIGILH